MHARALLSIHRFPPPLIVRPRIRVLLALLFIALPSLIFSLFPSPLHAAPRLVTCPAGSILYVAKSAGGLQTGMSWSNAYLSLQDALATAAACPSVRQIWVAEGVYYPDEGSNAVNNSDTASFVVPPGIALYGGFSGVETTLTQRSWAEHATVLSGDVDGNDNNTDGNSIAEDTSQLQGANAFHVLWLEGTGGTPITTTTRIDGFTVTGGYANGYVSTETGGGGLYCLGRGVGSECSPTVANVVFTGNKASYHGGALYADGSDGGESSPVVVNTVFTGNAARYNGGAVFNTGAKGTTVGTSSPQITNVTFYANTGGNGGGVYNDGSGGTCQPVLTNVILWNNIATSIGSQMFNAYAAPTLAYSLVQGGSGGIYNYNSTLTDGGNNGSSNGSADPRFVDAAHADLRLMLDSAARDAGTNIGAPAIDIRGLPRPVNGVADIGAYEAQAYRLTSNSGDKQRIGASETFTLPLVVTLSSPYEQMEPGAVVTYTPPVSGPGLTVTDPWIVPVDGNGQASSAVQGNSIAGRFTVTATARGVITPVIFTLTNTALNVTVARTGGGQGVVISSPAAIVCAPLCSAGFDYGRVVTFTATASTGSVFTGWVGDNAGGAYSVPDPATAAAYAAVADAAPDAAPDAVLGTDPGAIEAAGSAATAVSSGSVTYRMTSSRLITATFALSHYKVDVSAIPVEGGVAGGAGTFAYGMPLTVTANANEGYRFLYWTVNGSPVTSTAAYSFTLRANRTLVANFTPLPTAVADIVTVARGQAITISVLANDLDPVSELASSNPGLTVVTTTLPIGGDVTMVPDRTRVVYTARPDFLGTDTFTYTAIDANNSTTTGTVTVVVSNEAAPPPAPGTDPPPPGTDPPAPVVTDRLFLPALVR